MSLSITQQSVCWSEAFSQYLNIGVSVIDKLLGHRIQRPSSTTKTITSTTPHHKILLSNFLKRCFQDFSDPSCDFSGNVVGDGISIETPSTTFTTEIETTGPTTIKSLNKKVEEFNLLFQITTPPVRRQPSTTTIKSSTNQPIDHQSEAIREKVQTELRAAFLGRRN